MTLNVVLTDLKNVELTDLKNVELTDLKNVVLTDLKNSLAEAEFLHVRNTVSQWRTQEFCSGGWGQQIQLWTEDRENGDLGAVAP